MSTDDLLAYLDQSPSSWHVVESTRQRLLTAGFEELDESDGWPTLSSGFTVRGASLIAWRRAQGHEAHSPFRIVGAHTDSPGLRIKPQPDAGLLGWKQLAVEVYGGPLLNSWLDRDLGIAGRVTQRNGAARNIAVHESIARVPQLAIHLDRDVNDKGLLLDKQQHLSPIWGTGALAIGDFDQWLAGIANVEADSIAWWDLCLFDVQRAALLGSDQSLIASGRLDNQLSCWAATSALITGGEPSTTAVIALFDHEEVGSESASGAAGTFLAAVLERIGSTGESSRSDFHRALAASVCVSADNAHAVHPNYPERHEPGHRPLVNHGPAIKINANQRYATSPATAMVFQQACERARVPWQTFVSRNNMPCGSTIGPITATQLGVPTVDVGVPQLSMHSARELCGADDPNYLAAALTEFLSN